MFEKRLSIFLTVLVFILILMGGVVHNTGSSLACPDWPLCYGSVMPEMKGGVAIEHSHRLMATAVGLVTIALAVFLQKYTADKFLKNAGWVALGLVIFQGLLGGFTVIYKLPTAVSTAHLGTSMIFLALVLVITLSLNVKAPRPLPGEGLWVRGVTLLVYLQMLLGAFVRHTGAGLVCPDIPFCHGSAWPVGQHPMLLLHMAHRWMGVIVALGVLILPFLLKQFRGLASLASLAALIVLVQVVLGLLSVTTFLGVIPVTAHLGGATLLWMTMVSLCFLTRWKK